MSYDIHVSRYDKMRNSVDHVDENSHSRKEFFSRMADFLTLTSGQMRRSCSWAERNNILQFCCHNFLSSG